MRKWKIRSSFSANLAIVCPVKSPKSTKNWRGDSSALSLPRKSHEASVVASGAARWRTDRRHIFSVKSCRFALKIAVARGTDELVGDGQAQHTASELVLGINRKDIQANGFSLLGFVEVAVELDFGNGLRNSGLGDGF